MTTKKEMKNVIPVYYYKGDKNIWVQVGYIEGEVYHSKRNLAKHKFRIFEGFAMSNYVYNVCVDNNVSSVWLYIGNAIYESHISQWEASENRWDNKILKTHKLDNQHILEIEKMKIYHMDCNIFTMKGGTTIMDNQTDLDKIGPVASTGVDLGKYDKQVTTIEKADVIQLPSSYTPVVPGTMPPQHIPQWVLKISSVVLESIGEGEDKIEFRATEIFNLVQDDKGNLKGFPTGEGAKLMKFLKDMKIPSPDHLKSLKEVIDSIRGKQAAIKAEAKEKDGRTNTYLRFRY